MTGAQRGGRLGARLGTAFRSLWDGPSRARAGTPDVAYRPRADRFDRVVAEARRVQGW